MRLTHFRGFLSLLDCGSSVGVSQKLALIIKGTLWSKTLLTKMSVNVSVFCTETNYMTCKFKASSQDNVFEKQQQLIVAAPQKRHCCYYGV